MGHQIPSIPLRRVKLSEFEPYLSTLGEIYEKYQLNRVVGLGAATEGIPVLNRDARAQGDDLSANFASLEEWTARLSMAGSAAASQLPPVRSSVASSISKSSNIPLTAAKTRMYSGNAPPLDSIPSIYFDQNFVLGNPHTFSAVCEYADVTGVSSSDSGTTQRVLQEKLSHYLDVVEVHLIKEISQRSHSFFAALSNLQSLHQETQACVDRISELRERLHTLSKSSVKKGLQVVQLKRARGNLDIMHGGTDCPFFTKTNTHQLSSLLPKSNKRNP